LWFWQRGDEITQEQLFAVYKDTASNSAWTS
jgi:hypothetical protein